MTMTDTMTTVIDRWIDDPGFRREMRSDLEATLQGAGLDVDAETAAELRTIDWNLTDEELEQLLEKKRHYGC